MEKKGNEKIFQNALGRVGTAPENGDLQDSSTQVRAFLNLVFSNTHRISFSQ